MKIRYTMQQFIRWFKMFTGKSSLHMSQPMGLGVEIGDLRFYHNDLSSKLGWEGFPDTDGIKRNKLADGSLFYFPISLAQRGLALNDALLSRNDERHHAEFQLICKWFIDNQDSYGGWDCWSKSEKGTVTNYSAMAQGQIISLLIRSKVVQNLDIVGIDECIDKAVRLMLKEPLTRLYEDYLLFDETPVDSDGIILNGHIFAMWGLYDYINMYKSDASVANNLYLSFKGLCSLLPKLDRGYWSDYDLSGRISSPFYHELHLAQLDAISIQFDSDFVRKYKDKWARYKVNKNRAVVVKVMQKLVEKKFNEFVS